MKMGEREKYGRLCFISEQSERLHGGNDAASLTSKASDFILSTPVSRRQPRAFLRKTDGKFTKICYNEFGKSEFDEVNSRFPAEMVE